MIDDKRVLVTGGTGSIGSVLVKKLLTEFNLKQLRILDNNEASLFEATQKYQDEEKLRFLLGDIRDKSRVKTAMKEIDVVFHAAALKHLGLNEYSPFEAVKTNVIGTQNLLEAAMDNQVERFINVSTDKAANPTSTMGASKLLAERLTIGANYYQGKGKTVFCNVRFGNVLNSSNSVVPIFRSQIEKGGPVTVTDKEMIRYFMTIEEAVSLIIKSASIARGGEVFILKMPALKIQDLAEVMIEMYAEGTVNIKQIGKKPGEKTYEKLVTSTEADQALELSDMYVIPQSIEFPNKREASVTDSFKAYQQEGAKKVPSEGVKPKKLLTKQEIKKLLERIV